MSRELPGGEAVPAHEAAIGEAADAAEAASNSRVLDVLAQIGRASCRERVCQYV